MDLDLSLELGLDLVVDLELDLDLDLYLYLTTEIEKKNGGRPWTLLKMCIKYKCRTHRACNKRANPKNVGTAAWVITVLQ